MFSKIANDSLIKKLTSYAVDLKKEVFVVGGAVRDLLLGAVRQTKDLDIDIASTLNIEEIVRFATMNNIKHEIKNKKLQVVALFYENNCYEIARLRREEYSSKFTHTPDKVLFTEDVTEDAKRRDFTANSVYYVTHSNEIIDPFAGVKDIKEKRLRTVLKPEDTLSVDPARIIRMVELSARFDFKIDKETLSVAKMYADNVNKLSKPRLKKELERLYQSNKYMGENELEYFNRVNNLINNKLGLVIN